MHKKIYFRAGNYIDICAANMYFLTNDNVAILKIRKCVVWISCQDIYSSNAISNLSA
ncbi:MAG: hypothetical protein KGD63_13155 [Candidatus Lokiarchaeota archaeon]|nr:hypothetical protein [Candidatus Lokiarchaeota archaeon]